MCVRGKVLFTDTAEPLPNANIGISTSSVKLATLCSNGPTHTLRRQERVERESERETEKQRKRSMINSSLLPG